MKSSTHLADRLIAYRKRQGLSQEELADMAKLSLRTVQRLEKGQSLPRGFTLQALAEALKLPIDGLTMAEPEEVHQHKESSVGHIPQESTRAYIALMYLSAFSYLLLPGANIILPLFMRYRKSQSSLIQEAGSQLLNFELVWTLITYGGYLTLLAIQIGLLLYAEIVMVWTPLLFLFVLYAVHVPLLLLGAWRAKIGQFEGYPVGLRLF